MWLELTLVPDATHGRGTDTDALGHPLPAPVGHPLGGCQGLGEDALPDLPAVRPRTTPVRGVIEPIEAPLLEALTPQDDRRHRHTQLVRDPDVRDALGGAQDDAGAQRQALLGGPGADDRTQDLDFGLAHGKGRRRMGVDLNDSPCVHTPRAGP